MLTSRQYFGLLDQLDAFLLHPAVTPETYESAAREVTKALGRGVSRLQERADVALATLKAVAGEAHGDSDEADEGDASDDATRLVPVSAGPAEAALHEVRKAARRLRHAAEAVAPGTRGGKKYRRIAAAAKDVEKTLGVHRDDQRFSEYLSDVATRAFAAKEATFVYGVLATRAEPPHRGATAELRGAIKHIGSLARKL